MRWVLLVLVLLLASGCKKDGEKARPSGLSAAEYEAEIAFLREELHRGEARDATNSIINVHEHLMAPEHFPRYLAAARRHGIKRTVVVTSPEFTLFGKGDKSYRTMAANWKELKAAAARFPGEILPFAAVDPLDPDKLAHLEQMVAEGALGVKLYSGHSNLYDRPLDDPSMMPVYAYLEDKQLPVNWHINLSKYGDELGRVLERHPNLNVMIPHYGVAFWAPETALPALMKLLRAHPSVYIDTSLGTREILIDGMFAIAEHTELFRQFFSEFQDRIVYGSDSVITGNKEKTTSWYHLVIAATRDHLETQTFVCPLAEGYAKYYREKKRGHNPEGRVRGLALADDILRKVYETNALAWLTKYEPLPALGD